MIKRREGVTGGAVGAFTSLYLTDRLFVAPNEFCYTDRAPPLVLAFLYICAGWLSQPYLFYFSLRLDRPDQISLLLIKERSTHKGSSWKEQKDQARPRDVHEDINQLHLSCERRVSSIQTLVTWSHFPFIQRLSWHNMETSLICVYLLLSSVHAWPYCVWALLLYFPRLYLHL